MIDMARYDMIIVVGLRPNGLDAVGPLDLANGLIH